MRNQRRKRKRLSRTDRERENREMRTQKERDAYSRAKGLARMYYGKWKALVEQNKKNPGQNQGKYSVSVKIE